MSNDIKDKDKMSIMITGANGFTGKHACDYFKNAGYKVIAITRNTSNLISDHNISYEHCELTNKNSVYSLINKIKPDYLLHLAGQNQVQHSWSDPILSIEANTMSTAYLIDALRVINPTCKIIVVGSALQFNPNDISSLIHPYSLSKTLQSLIAQSWEQLYKMDIIIAKPSNLIGPGNSNGICSILAKKVIDMEINNSEKLLELNNLYAKRDFVDVRDAVAAYETLFLQGVSGEIYDICTGESKYLKDLTDTLYLLSGIDFKIKYIQNTPETTEETFPSLLKNLGWNPLIPFETSIQTILAYFREQNHKTT